MIKIRRMLSTVMFFGLSLLLSGCHAVVLNPQGPIAAEEKQLLITAVLLMLIIVIPVIILTFAIAIKYRASNTKAMYTPDWSHNTKLEIIWWVIPIVIIAILAGITWITTHQLDPYRPLVSKTKPLTIEVVALEWRWLFIYPQQNIATLNEVRFPVNTPVDFLITADAPMNSFQIQQLAGQIYAMDGMQTKLHLIADKVGIYPGRSVSFSGNGFSNMIFKAQATTPQAFKQWVKSVKRSRNILTLSAYNKLISPVENQDIKYFSSVNSNLFSNIMMKFMKPMQTSSIAQKNIKPISMKVIYS